MSSPLLPTDSAEIQTAWQNEEGGVRLCAGVLEFMLLPTLRLRYSRSQPWECVQPHLGASKHTTLSAWETPVCFYLKYLLDPLRPIFKVTFLVKLPVNTIPLFHCGDLHCTLFIGTITTLSCHYLSTC